MYLCSPSSLSSIQRAYSSNSDLSTGDDDEKLLLEQAQAELSPGRYEGGAQKKTVEQQPLGTNRERKSRRKGWRAGVTVAACTALVVMTLNLSILIATAVTFKDTIEDGIGTAYEGECQTVNEWSTALALAINILSSALLGASNYTMQCLCSPTREEIDRAHSKGDWLDIGLPSVRNILGRISHARIGVWLLLALSSAPIHLLYNSSIFKTMDANMYNALVVNEDFLRDQPFSTHFSSSYSLNDPIPWDLTGTPRLYSKLRETQSFFSNSASDTSAVQKLTNPECITAYGTFFV